MAKNQHSPTLPPLSEDVILSHKEAAARMGIASQTLYNLRGRHEGPCYIRLGRKPVYRLSDIEAYLNARRIETRRAFGLPDDPGQQV